MKVGLKWIVSFVIISIVAVGGLFWRPDFTAPNTGDFLGESAVVGSDVAWILAAAGLVLLMTPGLSFFYGGMVGKKKCYFHDAAEFYFFGSHFNSLDCGRFFAVFWRINRFYN